MRCGECGTYDDCCCRETKALRAELERVKGQRDEAVRLLKNMEFGHPVTQNKCLVCWGWDVGPHGETPRVHNETCELAKLLKEVSGE